MNSQPKIRLEVVLVFLAIAIASRFIGPRLFGYGINFAPVDAIALFSGAYISRRYLSMIIPIVFVWIGDLIANYQYYGEVVLFYEGFYWQYGAYLLIVLIGTLVGRNVKWYTVLGGALSGAVLFFIVSNFGTWASTTLYAKTWTGLVNCFVAAIPFFRQTLVSDLMYVGILFGTMELLKATSPKLALVRQKV